MTAPVALLIFNRPEQTARVFERVRGYRPSRLLVVADGPRSNDELAQCEAARKAVRDVDWPCDVLTNYSDLNLGCKHRVSSGLDWVFSECEEAIILEDDCLPHPTFFPFCEQLLERHREDDRIASISGNNFQNGRWRGDGDYYFSVYQHIWGWASWRRAWKDYDVALARWPARRGSRFLEHWLDDERAVEYWTERFDTTAAGLIDTWDYQWTFACWDTERYAALPNVNLVSNLGFGPGATHTTEARSPFAGMKTQAMRLPPRGPSRVAPDRRADRHTLLRNFAPRPTHRERVKNVVDLGKPTLARLAKAAGIRA